MAIQFCCTQCGQPIEVDDEHAGRTAACPYCQHLVSVPHESTFEPHAAVSARAVGPTPVPPGASDEQGPPHRVPVPPQRRRVAATFGLFALICTGLAVGLVAVAMVIATGAALRHMTGGPTPTLSDAQMQQVQKELIETPAFLVTQLGGLIFATAGLALGIVSLTQAARGNWRGLTSVVVCGLLLLCVCTAAVLDLTQGGGMVGPG